MVFSYLVVVRAIPFTNEVSYREANVLDVIEMMAIFNRGKNETYPLGLGGWCSQEPISYTEAISNWIDYRRKYGDNFTVSLRTKGGNIQSMIIAWIDGDTIYYKSVMWDFAISETSIANSTSWLQIIHEHVNEIAQWGKNKGAVKMSTDIVPDNWIYSYVTIVLNENGDLRKNRGENFEMDIRDFERLNLDYTQRLPYKPIPNSPPIEPFVIPKEAKQINNWTWKIGEHSTYFVFPTEDLHMYTDDSDFGNWLLFVDLRGVYLGEGYEVADAFLNLTFYKVDVNKTVDLYNYEGFEFNDTMTCSQLDEAYISNYEKVATGTPITKDELRVYTFNVTGTFKGVKHAVENGEQNVSIQMVFNAEKRWAAQDPSICSGVGNLEFLRASLGTGKTVRANATETAGTGVDPLLIINTVPIGGDPCEYSGSGNWNPPCDCDITSNVAGSLGTNLTINGTGIFKVTANITGFDNVIMRGISTSEKCEIIRADGGRL